MFVIGNMWLGLALVLIGFVIGRWTAESPVEKAKRKADDRMKAAQGLASLSAAGKARVKTLIAANHTIDAVKAVREELGVGLKESKDVVDALRKSTA
jgi:ribosomal protein L7/L12